MLLTMQNIVFFHFMAHNYTAGYSSRQQVPFIVALCPIALMLVLLLLLFLPQQWRRCSSSINVLVIIIRSTWQKTPSVKALQAGFQCPSPPLLELDGEDHSPLIERSQCV